MDLLQALLTDPIMTFVIGMSVGLIVGSWWTENENARNDHE